MGVNAEMAFAVPSGLSERELCRLSYEAYSAFGASPFWLGYPRNRHAFTLPAENEWRSVDAPDGWHVVFVNLNGRYYGPGYERGDWSTYSGIGRWLRHRLPGCIVYYGSDMGDVLSELTELVDGEMWQHFADNGGRPYREGFHHVFSEDIPTPECPYCLEPMVCNGGGGGGRAAFYYCYCGYDRETRDGGSTWTARKCTA